MTQPIYILVTDSTGASAVAGPVDIFHTANLLLKNFVGADADYLRWKIVGEDLKEVTSSSGLKIQPELTLDDMQEPGWLFIPGVVKDSEQQMQLFLQQNQSLVNALRRLYHDGFAIAANCTGVFLLAETGLLDGKAATTTWWLENLFQKRYPRIDLDIDSLITEEDRLMCSGSVVNMPTCVVNTCSPATVTRARHRTADWPVISRTRSCNRPTAICSSIYTKNCAWKTWRAHWR